MHSCKAYTVLFMATCVTICATELAEKGPGFFLHPDDIPPRVMDPRPPSPKFRQTHSKHAAVGVDKVAVPRAAVHADNAAAPEVSVQESTGHQSAGACSIKSPPTTSFQVRAPSRVHRPPVFRCVIHQESTGHQSSGV